MNRAYLQMQVNYLLSTHLREPIFREVVNWYGDLVYRGTGRSASEYVLDDVFSHYTTSYRISHNTYGQEKFEFRVDFLNKVHRRKDKSEEMKYKLVQSLYAAFDDRSIYNVDVCIQGDLSIAIYDGFTEVRLVEVLLLTLEICESYRDLFSR